MLEHTLGRDARLLEDRHELGKLPQRVENACQQGVKHGQFGNVLGRRGAIAPLHLGAAFPVGRVAHALGLPDDGQGLAARVAAGFARVKGAPPPGKTAQKVLFILSVGRGAPLAGGAGSSADRMIRLAGGVNAINGFSGYKPLSVEMAIQAAPTAILVIDRTLDLMGGMEALRRSPLVANTPAGRNGNLIVMDGMYLLGFGPRTPEAARDLAVNLYGENGASGAGTGAGEAAVAPAR